MPSQYYRCPGCGAVDLVTYHSADVGGANWPPRCEAPAHDGPCGQPMEMAPRQMLTDLRTDGAGGRSFQKFTISLGGRDVVIDSLHKAQAIERESEQRYRNGEGEPIRFRMLHQDRANKDVNTFGNAGQIGEQAYSNGQQPAKSGKIGIRRHGEDQPRVKVARHAGQSALKG